LVEVVGAVVGVAADNCCDSVAGFDPVADGVVGVGAVEGGGGRVGRLDLAKRVVIPDPIRWGGVEG
jgi:hypothetical protein